MNVEAFKNPRVRTAIVSVVSLAAGAGASYYLTVKKLEAKYADISEQEIAEAKEFYRTLHEARNKPASPADVVAQLMQDESPLLEDAVEAIQQYAPEPLGRDFASRVLSTVGDEVISTNLFEQHGNEDPTGWNLELEMAKRDGSRPYVVSEEEWQAGEPGYDQITLNYYAGDNVLTDEQEVVVDNIEGVVGTENLSRFGDGTGDPDTMFIRNDRLKSDYEVVRSDGKYVDEVLSLNHSSEDWNPRRGVRKFRDQDE